MKDELGDRMKSMETENTPSVMPQDKPVIARLDGRGFSRFTKGMNRPFDSKMSTCMQRTAIHLLQHTGADVVYTQSDEITLVWSPPENGEIWFGGKLQKMVSNLASQATLNFNQQIQKIGDEWEFRFFEYRKRNPTFDARVWFVPSLTEATNVLWWREKDATRNAISMAAMGKFSHKELHKKTSNEKLQMLKEKGVDFTLYPEFFTRGSYTIKSVISSKLEKSEIDQLPPKHDARLNPDLEFERNVILPIISPFPTPMTSLQPVVEELFKKNHAK
jgi:tRNA(His) 5'-end guanylyltransferase